MPNFLVKQADMLVCFLGRHRGEMLVKVAKAAGARGGTLALGQSLANSRLLQALSLADIQQDVLFMLMGAEKDRVLRAIREAARKEPRRLAGTALLVRVPELFLNTNSITQRFLARGTADAVEVSGGGGGPGQAARGGGGLDLSVPAGPLRSGSFDADLREPPLGAGEIQEARKEVMEAEYKLITVIVNAGCADDAMAAARKAGATGGTIFNARGTGTPDDVKFFGITLVPEKEMLMIVARREHARGIVEAIGKIPALSKPGAGIVFNLDVPEFFLLGSQTTWSEPNAT